jgi:hypothetical protein
VALRLLDLRDGFVFDPSDARPGLAEIANIAASIPSEWLSAPGATSRTFESPPHRRPRRKIRA